MTTLKKIELVLNNHPELVKIMAILGYNRKDLISRLHYIANHYIVLTDNDGTIRDTNSVKDACLNAFCVSLWGEIKKNVELPTSIHRRMHGRPMGEIFVAIAKECYNIDINLSDGENITAQLNDFIRPEYVKRCVYDGAKEFYSILKEIGTPMYILTGMEADMVSDGLIHHNMGEIFEDILGAPKTKEQNIKEVLQKHTGRRILAMGDAMSEYKETMVYENTIFLAFDFESRKKRVFPQNVNILTSYGPDVWKELFKQLPA